VGVAKATVPRRRIRSHLPVSKQSQNQASDLPDEVPAGPRIAAGGWPVPIAQVAMAE
jgi:hypothetical protein